MTHNILVKVEYALGNLGPKKAAEKRQFDARWIQYFQSKYRTSSIRSSL